VDSISQERKVAARGGEKNIVIKREGGPSRKKGKKRRPSNFKLFIEKRKGGGAETLPCYCRERGKEVLKGKRGNFLGGATREVEAS